MLNLHHVGSGLLHDLPFKNNLDFSVDAACVVYIVVDCVISLSFASALNIIVGKKKHPFSHCVLDHFWVICMLPDSYSYRKQPGFCARTSRLSPTRLWPLCMLSFSYVSPSFVYIPVMWFICGYSHGSPGVFI